jgi:hypothetical protein
VLAYRSLRISMSHFMIELYVVSCTPHDSMPTYTLIDHIHI